MPYADRDGRLIAIFSAIFTLASGLIAIVLVELKRNFGPYAKSGLSLSVMWLWGFILFPLQIVLPIIVAIGSRYQ